MSLYIDLTQNVILDFILIILWYKFIYAYREKILLDIFVFPFSNFPAILNPYKFPATIPIVSYYFAYMGDILMVISNRSWKVFVIVWAISMIFRFLLMSLYLFNNKRNLVFSISGLITAGLIFVVIYSFLVNDYERTMSPISFILDIYLFFAAIFIVTRIVLKKLFVEKIVDFFIFFGITVHSFLQILASIPQLVSYSDYFYIAAWGNTILKIFWIISVPWILSLQKKFAEA